MRTLPPSLHYSITLSALLWLASCDGGETPAIERPSVEMLSPEEQVIRLSMALRGVRPSPEELASAADTERFEQTYEQLVDVYLDSELFGETIKDLHAQIYLLRNDTEVQLPPRGILGVLGYNQGDTYKSTVEAPLTLIRDIIMEDQPYTNILTAEYTLADPVLALIYGMPYDFEGPFWQKTQWADGRPQSGILSESQIWRRYTSNASNYNRGRANFLSNTFLCENIGGRDVAPEEGIDLSDPEVVKSAIKTSDSCVGCHAALDPLASFLWGYKVSLGGAAVTLSYDSGCTGNYFPGDPVRSSFEIAHWCYPVRFYNAVDADLWKSLEMPPPGYYGVPAENMTDLGHLIAQDPRFADCTARTFTAYLTQTERDLVPYDTVAEMRAHLEANNFSIKQLVKRIVMSDTFRALRPAADAPSEGSEEAPFIAGLLTIRPEQYARTIEDLTGFRWLSNPDSPDCATTSGTCWGDVDLGDSDLYGYRSMSGGVDSLAITRPTHTASPTKALAMSKFADQASGFVVNEDLSRPAAERKLLSLVEADTTEEGAVRAQIAALHSRILGESLQTDSEILSQSYSLWSSVLSRSGDPAHAWRVLISALLQDVRMVYY